MTARGGRGGPDAHRPATAALRGTPGKDLEA